MIWLAFLPFAAWLYLLLFHGSFWRTRERDSLNLPPALATYPSVVAVVPARNEADVIARTIGSLAAQDYDGRFHIVLVDDQSDDGTAKTIRDKGWDRVTVLDGASRPEGWTGKLWAVSQGIDYAKTNFQPDYVWLTDADIAHTPDNLKQLVARAEGQGLVLVSLMAKLSCANFAERLLIPAFVFFFAMLFPFGWVNDKKNKMAAAAGGCMLVKREALEQAGGIQSIRHAIIDDCALGARMKAVGPVWLGLTDRAVSIRPYEGMGEISRMVSRSAYAQLRYSPLLLAGTVLGMAFVYLAAPAMALFGTGLVRIAGILAWLSMVVAFAPMLRFYGLSILWGLLLPLIGLLYTVFTFQSAIQFWLGKGGMWKGRAQAIRT